MQATAGTPNPKVRNQTDGMECQDHLPLEGQTASSISAQWLVPMAVFNNGVASDPDLCDKSTVTHVILFDGSWSIDDLIVCKFLGASPSDGSYNSLMTRKRPVSGKIKRMKTDSSEVQNSEAIARQGSRNTSHHSV